MEDFSIKKIGIIAISVIMGIIILWFSFTGITNVDSSEIVVYQSPMGKMEVWTTPGYKLRLSGTTTTYQKSDEFEFSATKNEKGETETASCTATRFNDKGSAFICGQASFDLPTDHKQMLTLHEKFRSMEAIKDRLVKTAITKGIYNSGPLMSSKESAGQRRAELISFIQDQATVGVFKTKSTKTEVDDLNAPPLEVTECYDRPVVDEDGVAKLDDDGKAVIEKVCEKVKKPRKKVITIIEPRKNGGRYEVQEESAATVFGIRLYNITVEAIVYEQSVQNQIAKQRNLEMEIQTSIAKAETAKQEAITAEQSGKAQAQKAKWDQEVKKAKAVTEAEQKMAVAKLALEEEKLKAEAVVTKAKAEAEAKELVLKADGALKDKLAAYIEVQKAYAEALGKHRLTPDVIFGQDKGGPAGTQEIMQMLGVKAARDLQLDLGVKK